MCVSKVLIPVVGTIPILFATLFVRFPNLLRTTCRAFEQCGRDFLKQVRLVMFNR